RAEGAAPFYNVYQLISQPGYADKTTKKKLNVKVVPNPYIVFNEWEKTSEQRVIKFTNLPSICTIRIFTTAGDLVKVIEHKDTKKQPLDEGGTANWDLVNDYGQLIASGVYLFHVESPVGEFTGKFMFIH
ncbi:MAG: T9SS C-terminal target domain-containing protein, partial [candidate division WOR-3 bacterium]